MNQDQRLVLLNGQGSDVNTILSTVLTAPDNTTYNSSFRLRGYRTDLNMDGATLFMGPENDANVLLGNILLHPANTGFASNFMVEGGMSQ
ncbi:MAG: hypothetical protein R3E95_03825 [Thiolinea sp.]